MGRFLVHESRASKSLLLDVQSDLLDHLNTRVVVPLMLESDAPIPANRLNPTFIINDVKYIMVTQFMATVPVSMLKNAVCDLTESSDEITNAVDFLTTGF